MDCKLGYFGRLCDTPCLPGFYGKQCAGTCHPLCSVDECDPKYGCNITITEIIQRTETEDVTEVVLSQSELNSSYLLLGMGGVTCVFLLSYYNFVKSLIPKEQKIFALYLKWKIIVRVKTILNAKKGIRTHAILYLIQRKQLTVHWTLNMTTSTKY
uniref:Uncharacterized protein LOC111103533 n=1 Tax=Crassostrea virginica TaxID=6565 RepID=A0A8B8ANE9_CRAVI|nr:uncharacterized protein LOC111103533 [Crassostrea virginica]